MEVTGWLIVAGTKKAWGWEGRLTRVLAKKPPTAANEVAIRVTLDLPNTLFERPQLEARITVPADAMGAPQISAEVQDNIAAVLSEQLGVRVHLSADPAEEA